MNKRTGIRAILTDREIAMMVVAVASNEAMTPKQHEMAHRADQKLRDSGYRLTHRVPKPCRCNSLAAG